MIEYLHDARSPPHLKDSRLCGCRGLGWGSFTLAWGPIDPQSERPLQFQRARPVPKTAIDPPSNPFYVRHIVLHKDKMF
jgi:hypothetical protein